MKWVIKTGPELTSSELYELLKLRVEIFVVEQNCPYQDLDDQDLQPTIFHVRAFSDTDELLAYNRVMYNGKDQTQARIGRVVVKESARSIGLGRDLMNHALDFIQANQEKYPRKTVMLHGQAHLRKWYESFGFEVKGGEFLEGEQQISEDGKFLEDGIPHYLFIKQL